MSSLVTRIPSSKKCLKNTLESMVAEVMTTFSFLFDASASFVKPRSKSVLIDLS